MCSIAVGEAVTEKSSARVALDCVRETKTNLRRTGNLLYRLSCTEVFLDSRVYRWLDKFIDSSGREWQGKTEADRGDGRSDGNREPPQKAINKFDTKVGKLAKLP